MKHHVLAICLMLIMVACSTTQAVTPSPARTTPRVNVPRPQLTVDTLPRISGSTSTQPVTVVWMCNLLGLKYNWYEEATGDSPRSVAPEWDWKKPSYEQDAQKFWEHLRHSKTHQSYVELIEGRADLILVARTPSADEEKLAQERGVKLDIQPFAWDALVFLVNERNSIGSLTLAQIQDIYSGKAATWESLGGTSKDHVAPLLRNENSGSHELFKKLVMKDRRIVAAQGEVIITMMGLVDRVGASPNDLGYSVFYYTQAMVGLSGKITPSPLFLSPPPPVKLIAMDGIMPSKQTIANGAYSLREPVYVVIRADAGASIAQLRDWLLSNEGQKVVEASGYVIWN